MYEIIRNSYYNSGINQLFLAFTHLSYLACWWLNENLIEHNGSPLKTDEHYKNWSRMALKRRETAGLGQIKWLVIEET